MDPQYPYRCYYQNAERDGAVLVTRDVSDTLVEVLSNGRILGVAVLYFEPIERTSPWLVERTEFPPLKYESLRDALPGVEFNEAGISLDEEDIFEDCLYDRIMEFNNDQKRKKRKR